MDENSLAAEHLEPGDRVLEIEGMDTTMLSPSEVESLLTNPSSKLELLIMKKTKSSQGVKGATTQEKVAKTVKTRETVSSTTEGIAKTELLSEDLMKESGVISTEGTLHKQVMETTDFAEEQETNTFWTSSTISKPSKTTPTRQEPISNEFWSADSSETTKNSGIFFGSEKLNDMSSCAKSKPSYTESNERTTQIPTNQQSTEPTNSSQANYTHGQPRETQKTEHKMDTFWTCPPSDLVKQESQKTIKEENLGCRNTSGSSCISESQIFKSLNSYRDELRKMDPREEKRRFWESCRKEDSVRRFKWGDSIKPSRVSSTTASTECLYNRTDTQPVHIPKTERSKSCEPMESHTPSNPFSKSFNDFQFSPNVSPTNPFYSEFETLNQNCSSFTTDSQISSSESNFQFSKERSEIKHDICSSQGNENFQFPTARSFSPNYEFVGDIQASERNATFREPTSTFQEVNATKNGIPNQNCQFRPTKAMSKEEFENKCKFFEKASSVPVSCVNAKAKGLVEERLKEPSPSVESVDNSVAQNAHSQTVENPESAKISPLTNFTSEGFHHPLMKPSDFINQQLKSKTSVETPPHGFLPKIEIQDVSSFSKDNCYPDSSTQNAESYSKDALKNKENTMASNVETVQKVEPIYENLRCPSQAGTSSQVGPSSTDNERILMYSNVQDTCCAQQEAANRSDTSESAAHNYESKFYSGNSSNVSSRASEIQASREERLRESLNKKIEWFFDGMKTNDVLNDQVQSYRNISSDRDFYERKTFKESSFEKVTRSSHSPYENVESASSREYQEESGPGRNFAGRSRTPAGFYDNTMIDDFGNEYRAKSPLDISQKSFQDIRNRLGSLLGGTPTNISCSHTKIQVSQGVDNVEEAFHKLAVQEGIVDSTSSETGTKS